VVAVVVVVVAGVEVSLEEVVVLEAVDFGEVVPVFEVVVDVRVEDLLVERVLDEQ